MSETQEKQLQADKWKTMSLGELNEQRDILTERISALLSLGVNSSPTISALYQAHQEAKKHLDYIIENKFKS